MSVTFRVNSEKLQDYLAKAPERAERILQRWKEEGSNKTIEQMRILTPVKTGFLRDSITRDFTHVGFRVYPTASYAQFVEEDTAPHTIFPSNARVLSWETSTGQRIFAMRVNHPGTHGQHFIRRTFDAMREALLQLYAAIWREKS